ncbi:MAG: 4-hydroxy-tetrahydrodipicolinate reductase [Candidatus Methanoperedens sp.]
MIKIAVNGAGGKMGRLLIGNIIRSNDMQLVAAIVANMDKVTHFDSGNIPITDTKNADTMLEKLKPDVLIDFTNASCAVEIIKACAHNGLNIVVGTTGFTEEQQREIEHTIKKSNIAAVISPNFSIGVNVFWVLIAEAAKRFEDYDIEIIETHHNQKKDAPSGTAMKAAKIISDTLGGKDFVYGRHGLLPRQNEIGIHAIRGGDIIGDHLVLFAGDGERLEIKHQAHSRQAFASGALLAARWVMNAPGGIYSMEDVLGI